MSFVELFSVSVLVVSVPTHGDNLMVGHWALWEGGTKHGDISVGSLVYDPVTEQGVLNDWDLTREAGQNRKPSAEDNIKAVPFLALDLLRKRDFRNLVPRRYRHDAEAFTWCLIYICICIGKDDNGRITLNNPHHSSLWFTNLRASYWFRVGLDTGEPFQQLPLHRRNLVTTLYQYWMDRFSDQSRAERSGKPYVEPSDDVLFKQLVENVIGLLPPYAEDVKERVRSRYRVG